jgi:hypothetical protein
VTVKFMQNIEIIERQVGAKTFLISDELGTIHELDLISAAIWQELVEPCSISECASVLHAVFPDTALSDIQADLEPVFAELVESDMIFQI